MVRSRPNLILKVVGLAAFVLVAGLLSVIAGIASAILPWWLLLALFLAPAVALLVWIWPAVGLFIAFCFVFGIVPSFLGPRLNVGVGNLKAGDIILVVTFVAAMGKSLVAGRRWFPRITPYLPALVLMFIAFFISVAYGKLYLHNETAMAEARNFIAWLILPTVLALTRNDAERKLLIRALLAMALVGAGGVIGQALMGIHIMELGRVELLDVRHSDVTRVTAGGVTYIMVFFLFRAIARRLTYAGGLLSLAFVGGVIALALLLTFGRGVWIATAVCAFGVMILTGGLRAALKGAVLGGLAIALAVVPLVAFKPKTYDAIVDRASGTGREFRDGGSFGWRQQENAIAIERIKEKPLLGVGMGGQYKTVRSSIGSFEIELTYIHNGYLFFPLKMGLWAVVLPWIIIVTVLRRGFVGYRGAKDAASRSDIAAAIGAFSTVVVVSFTQPEWSSLSGIASIAILMAIIELYRAPEVQELRIPRTSVPPPVVVPT